MNTNEWYQKVQLCRRLPPKRSPINPYNKPQCYALTIQNAQIPNLKMDISYRIHAYFYDKQRKYFFGKPYYGNWYHSDSDSIHFTEVIFFWCPFIDNIEIVLEVVEGRQNANSWEGLFTAAWTSLPLEIAGNQTSFCRFSLYPGSPKALFFINSEMQLTNLHRQVNIDLEVCLQKYEEMYGVLDFIPDWYMFSQWEDIPGLRSFHDGESQTDHPEPLKSQTSFLSKINVSFGMDVYKYEQILLHLMNNDRLYRANRSPAEINVKTMEVVERRLTIGVHNGLCYVEKPQCLRLGLSENQIYSASEIRNKLESRSLCMNGTVTLNRLITDSHFAIVFSLDYLVGVYSCDGTVHSSQSVMVCWGAWCPFAGDNVPSGEVTVPLFGGPCINPDERMAFQNLVAFRSHLPFCNHLSKITITFVCSGLEEVEQQSDTSRLINNKSQLQNLKRTNVKITRHRSSTIVAQNSEKMPENRNEIELLPSSPAFDNLRIAQEGGKFENIRSSDERKINAYTSVKIYSSPLVKTSNISRASRAALSDISFAPIKDRNGNKPKLVDLENFPAPDINVELNDKLNTNETIIQFMGVEISSRNDYIKIPTAIFFTMEFYRFHTVTTEKLWLNAIHANTNPYQHLFVLKRKGNIEQNTEKSCNGFTVRYMISKNSFLDGDEEDYINYLLNGYAIIDVWDADSLLPLGKSYIPLKSLIRHGSEAVQHDIQCAVVLGNFSESSIITCQVLLRLANIGHPSFKQSDPVRSGTGAVVCRQLIRTGQNGSESYKIRAKPLNPIHENSLQRFLIAQRLDIDQRCNEMTNDSSGAKNHSSTLKTITTKGSVKRYLFQQELEAYKKLRDEDKASKLLKVVFKAITTEYCIYPKYGQVIFFEYMLQNTEPEPVVIIVDTSQSTLKPLLDLELWQHFKNIYRIKTPLERDLYRVSKENEQIAEVYIFLKPMETVCTPFIYDGFELTQEQIKNQVKIIFKKKNSGEPIAILDLMVTTRHNIISNTFRFYHEAETTLSRIIRITGYKSRVFSIRCTDPLVLISFKNNNNGSQDLHFTCQTGRVPMLRTFMVIFFADQYYSSVLGAWSIYIHAVNQINLNAIRAQLIKIPIFFKVDENCTDLVHFETSSKNFDFHPSDTNGAQYGGIMNAMVHFIPNFTGSRIVLISAINQRTYHLLYQWMIVINAQEANITKIFEVYLQNGVNQTIALSVKNRYSIERTFRISCSHPEHARIKNNIVILSGYKTVDVSITFLLNTGLKLPEVLIFITNVENNVLEEAYSMKLIYHC